MYTECEGVSLGEEAAGLGPWCPGARVTPCVEGDGRESELGDTIAAPAAVVAMDLFLF